MFQNKSDIIKINSIKEIVNNEEEFNKDQNFECQLCMDYIINELEPSKMKVLQCINGHFFCYNCWDKHLNNDKIEKKECPICKVYIGSISSLSNNLFLTNLFKNKVKVKCPTNIINESSSVFGEVCFKIIKLEELETHMKTCIYSLVKCEISTLCEEKVKLKDKIHHELNKCIYRTTECPFCKEKIRLKDHLLHIQNDCKEYIDNCRKCNIKIKLIDYDKHLNEECMESKIDCVIKDCFSSFLRKDLMSHCQEKGNHDHSEISNQLVKLEKERKELYILYRDQSNTILELYSKLSLDKIPQSLGSGGLFCGQHTTSKTPQTGGLFGSTSNSSSLNSGGLFGGALTTTPHTGGLFGSTSTSSSFKPFGGFVPPPTGLFGSTSTTPTIPTTTTPTTTTPTTTTTTT